MSLTFYYAPMTSATRVHWALEELGVPYEKVKLDLGAGDQKKPEYLALNPNGKVPLLVVDGTPVFESLAILIYLGETYGVDKGLFPAPGVARADAFKWMAWANVSLGDAMMRMIRNLGERFPAEQRNVAAGEQAKKDAHELWGMVDRALEGKEYLVGNSFTLVDLAVGGFVMISSRLGVDLGAYKNVQAWSARCNARPALGRVMGEYMGGAR
jgi:glutathione S-transferase